MSAARKKAVRMIEKLRGLRLTNVAELVEAAVEETLTYYAFPEEHWRRIRTTDEMDKLFYDEQSLVEPHPTPFFCSTAPQAFFRPDRHLAAASAARCLRSFWVAMNRLARLTACREKLANRAAAAAARQQEKIAARDMEEKATGNLHDAAVRISGFALARIGTRCPGSRAAAASPSGSFIPTMMRCCFKRRGRSS
jgi:hypothetical protein